MVKTENPDVKETHQRVGHQTTLATPLLSQGEALGAISVPTIARPVTNDVEHFACRGLVFERFLQLSLARLLSLEQARVLNGDHGLVGEGLQQRDLFFREGFCRQATEQ
jgi:hypothetical protein